MRFFFLVLLFITLMPFSSWSQEAGAALPEVLQTKKAPSYPDENSLYTKLYKDCLNYPLTGLPQGDREFFCGCYNKEVHDANLSEKELRSFVLKQGDWWIIKDKMIMGPYASCVVQTVKGFAENECFLNFKKQPAVKHTRKICQCTGEEMDTYFKDHIYQILSNELMDHPKDVSPFSEFVTSDTFRISYRNTEHRCLGRHEYGWK